MIYDHQDDARYLSIVAFKSTFLNKRPSGFCRMNRGGGQYATWNAACTLYPYEPE